LGSLDGNHYDAVVIGAGMSGLAAGIRLRLGEKKTLIVERHEAPGGLNSFYRLGDHRYDVGLHAMTNYVGRGARQAPLSKLFRQLRIRREDFDLSEQLGSRIRFPGTSLRFTNDFAVLVSEVERVFPREVDGFLKLAEFVRGYDSTRLDDSGNLSARGHLEKYLKEPLLREMLLCPIFYYGSARENDIDLGQFCIMFQSLFFEGFARPYAGVRQIIGTLTRKYASLGGERRMRTGVREIRTSGNRVKALILESGDVITADKVISSAGLVETLRLCSDYPDHGHEEEKTDNIGRLSFVETINILNRQPQEMGWKDTIVFFSTTEQLHYERPESHLVDPRSGVICFPNNYAYPERKTLPEGWLRVTALANYDRWAGLDEVTYCEEKHIWFSRLTRQAVELLAECGGLDVSLDAFTVARDMFTPKTITKYTGHLAGAVYGAPHKRKDGKTHLENLFIAGTDQGFLGIVGAMLSGISIANAYVLKGS